ncbi:hypothetical protein GOBAR_DD29943 [Gossypium barbadense]|nr:hypothetical protein GOBAR_DD29943 [Gossypium barbadense]
MASYFSVTDLNLLLSCAEDIEYGDLKSADELLQKILILVDERPYPYQRVVKYFADALVRRAYGLHPASSYFTFRVDPAPYYHYNSYRINGAIKEVIYAALMGNRRFHLIDFSIPYYRFQNSVLRTLPNFFGYPLSVRVSYILPPFLKKYVKFSRQMEFLTKDAKEVNVKLDDKLKVVYGNSLAEVDECEIDFKRRRDDEMVVVYYKFKLDKLVRDAKAMERELVRLKEIKPTIVIMLDFYSNHTHSNFLTCFKDSFQYCWKTLDYWAELDHNLDWKYGWECNIEAGEGNNIIRRHPTLTEWQHLFSRAGFSRIPLNHRKYNLSVEDESPFFGYKFWPFGDTSFLEIMREEEECLILGNKGCPMFFLSAWKPKVEDGHFNSNSTNHKFGQGFNPNPLPLQPLQPFLEGLILNRSAALAEIHDISKDLCCKYKLSLAVTWAAKVNNMNETISDPDKKHAFFIQSNTCYVKDSKSYHLMLVSENKISGSLIIEKAFESRDGYHFEPSLTKVKDFRHYMLEDCNIDVAVAICLQNRHKSDEVYIVEFYWPPTESEISKSKALRIFDDLKHMKTTFVTVKVQGPEIKFQEEAISSIPTSSNTAMPLKIAEEARDIHAIEINAHIEQVVAAPFNTLEGPYNKIVETKRNKQRKSWSKVWVDFDKFEEHGKQVAKCKHCPKVLTGSSKSGTTHLNNHSKVCPGKKKQNQESQLILPVDTNERSSTFDQERSHLDLVKMVIRHQYPLDLAGQEAFKNFVKGLQPMYEFQSRDKLLSDIHRIYNEGREKLQLYFDQLACKLNLTYGSTDKENCLSNLVSLSSTHWFINCTLLEDGFREMDDLLFKLKKSIEYVTETKHGRLKFQEAVDQVKLQDGKSWDDLSLKLASDFGILDSALRSREIFCKLEQIDGNFKLNPSMEEWENAAALQIGKKQSSFVTLMKGEIAPDYWDDSNSDSSMAKISSRFRYQFFTPCSNIKATINNPAYNILNPESMEALVCSENWLETPNGNDGENHEPTQTTDKGKRKLDEDTCVRKKSKPSNCEKAISTEDIAKDFNNNEFNHGRNFKDVNEISSDDSSSDFDQSDQVQSSSSESDDETTLKEQGQWCEQDVRVYLVSNFTNKDYERLDKLERKKLNRKSIGRDKELNLTGDKLEHLLMVPRSTETQKKYHINEVVINAFFKLLKERSRKFSKAYINHYSFDSQAANLLIKGSRSEREVLARYKPDHLRGVHKVSKNISFLAYN